MSAIRATAASILILVAASLSAAECLTGARIISTRASVPNLVNGPSAWNGMALAVAKGQEGSPSAIWVGLYDENFDLLAADRLIATNSRELIAIVWTGSEFGLFYRTDDSRLLLQRLSSTGQPVAAPVGVTPGRTVYSGDQIAAVWSPALDAYVVARYVSRGRDLGVWITFLEADGTQRSDRFANAFAGTQTELALAVTSTGIAGVFYEGTEGNLLMAQVADTGPAITRGVADDPGTDITVAALGNDFVVARSLPGVDRTEIWWFIVNSSHEIVRPDSFLVAGGGDDAWPLALAIGDEEIALAYLDAQRRATESNRYYRLRRFSSSGGLIGDTEFAATDNLAARAFSGEPFFWTGTSYLSAPVREASDRLNSYLVRYCPLVAEIQTERRTVLVNTSVLFTGLGSGGAPPYKYVWRFSHEVRIENTQSVQRTFQDTGTVTATLTVTDDTGVVTVTTYVIDVVRKRARAVRH